MYLSPFVPRGFYGYLLVNPMDRAVFYVGKGKGHTLVQPLPRRVAGSMFVAARAFTEPEP